MQNSHTRIKIPSRASDCTHLQCFDLNSYLLMNERRPDWKCPVCTGNAIPSKLIIDEYFELMLDSVGNSVSMVELLRDGTWQLPAAQKNIVSLVSEDEEGEAVLDDDNDIQIEENPDIMIVAESTNENRGGGGNRGKKRKVFKDFKQFLETKEPSTFAVNFTYELCDLQEIVEFHCENGIGEQLLGCKTGDMGFQVFRHQANARDKLHGFVESTKKINLWSNSILFGELTIGQIDGDYGEEEEKPSPSKKRRICK